jgi:hypothetical protein
MKYYYVSLVGVLRGYFIKAMAEKESYVRQWACKQLGQMWCSVYEPEYIENKPYFNRTKIIGSTVVLTMEDDELYDNYI